MTLQRTGCRAKSKNLDQDHCKLLGRSSTTQRRPDVVSRKAKDIGGWHSRCSALNTQEIWKT